MSRELRIEDGGWKKPTCAMRYPLSSIIYLPSPVRYLRLSVFICSLSLLMAGCADDQKNQTIADRQNAMLRDPMEAKADLKTHNISGGGLTNYDKDAMKKDLDDVLNP